MIPTHQIITKRLRHQQTRHNKQSHEPKPTIAVDSQNQNSMGGDNQRLYRARQQDNTQECLSCSNDTQCAPGQCWAANMTCYKCQARGHLGSR